MTHGPDTPPGSSIVGTTEQDSLQSAVASAAMFQNSNGMSFHNPNFYNIGGNMVASGSTIASVALPSDSEVKKIAEWFSPHNFRNIQSDTYEIHTEGTGKWLTGCEAFKNWLREEGKTFWITGIPGAGKTIISSIVTDHLQKESTRMPSVLVLVVYCRYHDKLSERDIFAALARQVVDSGAAELDLSLVKSFYDTNHRQNVTPSTPALLDLLDHLLTRFRKVIISIDALDEISDKAKEALLAAIGRFRSSCFITSRPLDGFRDLLPNTQILRLEDELLQNDDIQTFILTKLDMIPRLRGMCNGNDDLRAKICEKLKRKSAGMFLLCALQMNSLRCVTTVKKLWDAIEALPSGIKDMYRVTWERIHSQDEYEADLAQRAVVFITYAKETLTPIVLQHALAVSVDRRTFDPDDVPGVDVLVAVGCGLIVVDEGNEVVRLAHYTTHDFMVELGSALYPDPCAFIATTCVTYLSASGFPGQYMTWDKFDALGSRRRSDTFLSYSYEHWGDHARDHEQSLSPLPEALLAILDEWTEYPILSGNHTFRTTFYMFPTIDIYNPSHLAARYGLRHFLPLILSSKDDPTPEGWLPLHIAVKYYQTAIVMALLEDPATNVNAITVREDDGFQPSDESTTPLSVALAEKRDDITKLLLHRDDIDVNLPKFGEHVPLWEATASKDIAGLQLLLSHPKINVNIKRYSLSEAAARGSLDAVHALLRHPEIDIDWGYAIQHVVRRGSTETFRFLLSHPHFDVNVHSGHILNLSIAMERTWAVEAFLTHPDFDLNEEEAWTVLNSANTSGSRQIQELVRSHPLILDEPSQASSPITPVSEEGSSLNGIEDLSHALFSDGCRKGVNEDSAANEGTTMIATVLGNCIQGMKEPLQAIAPVETVSEKRLPVKGINDLRLLLSSAGFDMDANEDSATNWGTTLVEAAREGYTEGMKYLLSLNNVNVNMQDRRRRTALIAASRGGKENAVRLLLAHPDTDINAKNDRGESALSRAISCGHLKVAHLLLSHSGIDLGIALCEVAMYNDIETVKVLLSCDKVEVNWREPVTGNTLLAVAAGHGHLAIVHLLLSQPTIEVDWGTGLKIAAEAGSAFGANFLLAQEGINVNAQDENGNTALIAAISKGRRDQVHMLLAHPSIDVNLMNNRGDNALRFAAKGNDLVILRSLLAHPGLLDLDWGTSLIDASRESHWRMAEFLLSRREIDVNQRDPGEGETALTIAASQGHIKLVQVLLTHPAIDVNVSTKDGTPLMLAASQGRIVVVRGLLAHPNIDLDTKDCEGKTAVAYAQNPGYKKILAIILAHLPEDRDEGGIMTEPIRALWKDQVAKERERYLERKKEMEREREKARGRAREKEKEKEKKEREMEDNSEGEGNNKGKSEGKGRGKQRERDVGQKSRRQEGEQEEDKHSKRRKR